MTIPSWRLALAAGALVALGAIGGSLLHSAVSPDGQPRSAQAVAPGVVDAATAAAAGDSAALLDALGLNDPTSSSATATVQLAGLRGRLEARLAGLRKRLVHGTVIVLDREGKLRTIQLDHGTISALGSGSITIAEPGGTSVTVGTTADTRVRRERKPATLAALKVGDEVVAESTVTAGSAAATWIVVPPAGPAAAGAANG